MTPTEAKWNRRGAQAVQALLVTFVLLMVAAIRLYPGGTWLDPHSQGHDLWRNFLCDVLRPFALDAAVNHGAIYANAAFLLMIPGLAILWNILPAVLPAEPWMLRLIRASGTLGAVAMLGVALTVARPAVHSFAILAAGLPTLVAACVSLVALEQSGQKDLREFHHP